MVTITLDGQNIPGQEINGDNLEEILINIMEHPLVFNRLITEVKLNGYPYNEEIPHAAIEVKRLNINQLDLLTCSAEDVSLHFLQQGPILIEVLLQAIPKITEDFRLGDEVEANENFLRFLEPLHLLILMLDQSSQVIGIGEKIEVLEGDSLDSLLLRLANILDQIITIQQVNDWIYLADLLEYEVALELEKLGNLIPKLHKSGH